MRTLLLMGMIFATVLVPIVLARDPKPARGYRRLAWTMFALTAVWGALLRYVYFSL